MPELAGVKPLRPMLHKFNYVPIEQPILADGVVRFVGEPVAAVVASSEEEAEDIVDLVEVEIEEIAPVVDAKAAIAQGAQAVHGMAPTNVIVEGKVKTGGFDATWAAAAHIVGVEVRSRRQNALPLEPRGGHASLRPRHRPRHAHMLDPDAASDAHRDRRPGEYAGSRSAGHRARCGRWLRAKDVAADRIRHAGLAGPQASHLGRLDRGSPREPDRLLSQPRSIRHAARGVRSRWQAARFVRRCARQYRRLFMFSDHLRGRAADGHGRNARAI